ncbi:MAG: hypothetical protein SVY53_00145 [Chloroflexota bacterium]|nr:hypothetical protein [Chloroflexota bacterium]
MRNRLLISISLVLVGVLIITGSIYFIEPEEDVAVVPAAVDMGSVSLEGVETEDSTLGYPQAQGLYGGLVYWTEVIPNPDDPTNKSRVFVSTQSANSIFYADIDHSGDTPSVGDFQVLPDLDADAGFGQIPMFTADSNSGWIYFSWYPEGGSPMEMSEEDNRVPGLYKCNVEEGTLTSLEEEQEDQHHGPGRHITSSLFAYNGYMFFVERDEQWPEDGSEMNWEDVPVTNYLTHGTLDATTGDFTEVGKVKINSDREFWPSWENGIVLGADYLYVLNRGGHHGGYEQEGTILKSSTTYNALTSTTTFTDIPLPPNDYEEGWTDAWWDCMGVGPDGRIILLGWAQLQNYGEPCVAYTDNEGQTWYTHARNMEEEWWGNPGPNMTFSGTSDDYITFCGTMASEDKGTTWGPLPRGANDIPLWGGNPVETDPNNSQVFYLPTHEGIAVSSDGGYTFNRQGGNLTIEDAANPWDVWFEDMSAAAINSTTTRVVVNQRYWKEQDNWDWMNQGQAFYYMDVDHSGDSPSYGTFTLIEGLTDFASSENSQVNNFILDGSSGYLFFEGERQSYEGDWWEHGLFKCTVDSETASDVTEVTQTSVADHTFNHGGTWQDGYYDGEEPTWIAGHWEGEPVWVDGYEDENGNWVEGYWSGAEWVEGQWSGEWPQWVEGHWDGGVTVNEGDEYDEIIHARAPLIYQANMFYIESMTDWESATWVDEEWVDGIYIPGYWADATTTAYMRQGTIDSSGDFTPSTAGSATIANQELQPRCIVHNPYNNLIYILDEGMHWMETPTEPGIYRSSNTWDAITDETTFTKLDLPEPASETDRYEWRVLQCAPDGRLFISGESQGQNWEQVIGYSADEGENWTISSIDWDVGNPGRNFGFLGDATSYDVVCGNVYSSDKGLNWKSLPRTDLAKVVPNAACVKIDPNNSSMLYIPTTKGIGYSTDAGTTFTEMNEGLTAVQIRDLVLDSATGYGWAVAKSGIRSVQDYDTDAVWSKPIDPAGDDWSWYDTVDMDLSDPNGQTAYASSRHNDKIFKTSDGGLNWKCFRRPEPVYEPPDPEEGGGWHAWPRWEGQISALKVDQTGSSRLFIGYDARWFPHEPGATTFNLPYGQLWVVSSDGDTWTQILLRNSQEINDSYIELPDNNGEVRDRLIKGDVNIDDIVIVEEDGATVLYVAAHYQNESVPPIPEGEDRWNSNGQYSHETGLPFIYRVYRVEETDTGWTVTEDLVNNSIHIVDLVADSNGILYGIGKTFDESIYNTFIEEYQNDFKERMKEWAKKDQERYFYEDASYEFYHNIYNKIHGEFHDDYDPTYDAWAEEPGAEPAQEGGPPPGEGGPPPDDDEKEAFFRQALEDFYDEYFADWEWDSEAYDEYFESSFKDYFAETLKPEFDSHFDEDFDTHFNMDWEHMMPQQGLRIVFKKAIGGAWTALTMKGLNRSQSFHHHYSEATEVISVGQDPFDADAEVPYVGFNKYLYYLPSNVDGDTESESGDDVEEEWVLGYKYPAGTIINVIAEVMDSTASGAGIVLPVTEEEEAVMYLGTGVGVYAQPMSAASTEIDIPEGSTNDYEVPEQTRYIGGDVGEASVSIIVDIIDAPADAKIEISILRDSEASRISVGESDLYDIFDETATADDLTIKDIGYVVEIVKTNLTDANIGDATIIFKVGKAWVDEYGTSAIKIIRVSDDGSVQEVVPTEFTDYEGDQAVFEGTCENGLSHFGLAAVEVGETASIVEGSLLWIIVGAVALFIIGTAIAFLVMKRSKDNVAFEP